MLLTVKLNDYGKQLAVGGVGVSVTWMCNMWYVFVHLYIFQDRYVEHDDFWTVNPTPTHSDPKTKKKERLRHFLNQSGYQIHPRCACKTAIEYTALLQKWLRYMSATMFVWITS